MAQILPIILRWVENTIRQVSYHSTPISGTFPDISKPLLQMLLYAMASGVWEMNRLLSTLLPRVELSDFNFQGPLEDALDKFVAGKPEKEWNHVIPESGLKWMEGYTYELKGILEKPLLDKIQSVVKEGIGSSDKEGKTEDEVRDELRKILPSLTEHRLQAIARTESMRAYNMGQMVELKKSEEYVQGVEFCAILDSRTTDMCQERDGLILRANDPRVWDNTPPLHPNCRSILIPIIITEEIEDTRWDEDGLKFDNLLVEEPAMIRPKDKEHIQQIMTGAAAITKKKKVTSPEEKPKVEEKPKEPTEAEKLQSRYDCLMKELMEFQQELEVYNKIHSDLLKDYAATSSPSKRKEIMAEIKEMRERIEGHIGTIRNYQDIIASLDAELEVLRRKSQSGGAAKAGSGKKNAKGEWLEAPDGMEVPEKGIRRGRNGEGDQRAVDIWNKYHGPDAMKFPDPPRFKTSQEAEDWAKKNNLADNISLKPFALEVAQAVVDGVVLNLQKVPEAREHLQYLGNGDWFKKELEKLGTPEAKRLANTPSLTKAYAFVSSNTDVNALVVTERFARDADYFKRSLQDSADSQWLVPPPKGKEIVGVIHHEMGHVLDHTINRINSEIKREEAGETTFSSLYSSFHNNPNAPSILSQYATTNRNEMLAEAWGEYQINPNPRPFAKQIGMMLEAEYRARVNKVQDGLCTPSKTTKNWKF